MSRSIVRSLSAGNYVRDSPARRARDETEPRLQFEFVHLVNDTVDIIGQARALRLDAAIMLGHSSDDRKELSAVDRQAIAY